MHGACESYIMSRDRLLHESRWKVGQCLFRTISDKVESRQNLCRERHANSNHVHRSKVCGGIRELPQSRVRVEAERCPSQRPEAVAGKTHAHIGIARMAHELSTLGLKRYLDLLPHQATPPRLTTFLTTRSQSHPTPLLQEKSLKHVQTHKQNWSDTVEIHQGVPYCHA